MNRIKKLKVKQADGTFTDYIPIGADATYIDFNDGKNLEVKINEMETSIQTVQNSVQTEIDKKANKKKTYTVSIPTTGWSASAPYTKTITVNGILSTDEPIASLVKSTNSATRKAQQEAFNKISDIRTANNSITAYCDEEKLTTAITLKLEVLY